MRDSELPERFYRLLYFSPRPEDDERVCVAVLLRDDKDTYLEYDEKLEKAHCFAPDYEKESLAFVLETIKEKARDAVLRGKVPEFSPQFSLSSPRALLYPVDEKVRSVLRHRYLLKMRTTQHKDREKGLGNRIDNFLAERFGVPVSLARRRATADDLFGPSLARELPRDLVPKPVSRAFVFETEICLIDGVDLHVRSSELLVHRVNQVAHTFWQYKKAEEILPTLARKRIFRAALVFDGNGSEVESSLKWRLDYAFHQFEKDAEVTVKAGSRDQEAILGSTLMKLLPSGDARTLE